MIEALNRHFADDDNTVVLEQIAFLEAQLVDKSKEEEKVYRAYVAGAFDEHEFADKRRILKETAQVLMFEIERLKDRVLTREQIEEQKRFILHMAAQLKKADRLRNVPFEIKRQVIKLVVNQISIDTREQLIHVEGAISETYALVSLTGSNKSEPHLWNDKLVGSDPIEITNNLSRPPA